MKVLSKLWIVFAMIAVAIPFVLLMQYFQGLAVTGLNHQVVWGLYIAGFTTCLAVASGLLVFVGIAQFKGIDERQHLIASVAALGFLLAAGVLILADLGKPERFWMILVNNKTQSPLWWDAIAMNSLIGVALLQSAYGAFKMWKGDCELIPNKIASVLGVIVPLGLFLITTHVFSDMAASRPAWGNPIVPFAFISASLAAGAVIFSFLGADEEQTIAAKVMAPLIVVNIIFAVMLHLKAVPVESFNAKPYLTTGFWVVIALCNVVPLILCIVARKSSVIMSLAVVLLVVGMVIKKLDFIIPSYTANNFAYPGGASYSATMPEIMLTIGAFTMALAITGFVTMTADFLKSATVKVS